MTLRLSAFTLASAVFLFPLMAQTAHEERIRGPIDKNQTVILRGPESRSAIDRGAMEPWTLVHDMKLVLKASEEQSADLERLLEEQRDPSSVNFQRWLTPEEFGERFGLTEADLNTITGWLRSEGFTVDQVAHARNWVTFSGSAQQVGRTFQTELRRYDADGESHFANANAPSIPAALADVVSDLRGLDDFRPVPMWNRRLRPQYNGSSGSHYLAPDDLAAIYDIAALYKAGFDGTGQKLVIPGQTDINLADIRGFRTQFNLPAKDPQLVLTGTDPGIHSGDQMEANLDLEWSGAVARNATIVYVYSQNVFDSVQYAIDQNLAPVISLSYGACEVGIPSSYRSIAQQANAEGITWMSAAGDSGAAGCDGQGEKSARQGPAVIFPADIPEVTAVGGTEFNEGSGTYWSAQAGANGGSAPGYIPERAWNDTAMGYGIEGTGGGMSTVYAKPWWQAGPGVPADNARDLPDVALAAAASHDGYIVFMSGSLQVVGGTSAATPSFAGIVSLINQYVVAKGVQSKVGLGNINPTLYSLAAAGTAGAFHDVTVGDNIVPCATGSLGCIGGSFGYRAGPGYDLVTGLGSVDAYKLVTGWATLPPAIGTTTTLAVSPSSIAQTAAAQLTATVKAVTGSNMPTGSVTFSVGTTSLGMAAVSSSGVATVSVNGSALVTGSNPITASFSATGNFSNSIGSATLSVTAAAKTATTTTVGATPSTIPASATTQVTATVKPASGTIAPAGTVTFSLGSTTLGSEPLTSGAATLTVKGSSLAVGNNTVTATFASSGNFSNSTGTVTVSVTAPPIATTTAVVANPTTIPSSETTQLTATVKAASGSVAPTGSIAFSVGNTSLGSAQLSNGVASLSVRGTSVAVGNNTITAAYTATGNFTNSTGSVSVTVTSTAAATTTTLAANPATIAVSGSTVLTATVRAQTGSTPPTGSVSFAAGSTSLGSAALSGGVATLTVKGASLAVGGNTLSASFVATGNFATSSATTTITVTSPLPATTMSVTANPTSIASTASTVLTAIVRAASASAQPAGSVSFMVGTTTLGSVILSSGVATMTVKGASLATGANNIVASYSGSTFAGSTASVTVTVTGASVASKVAVSVTPQPASSRIPGWLVNVKLQEQAGVSTTISGFTISGTDFSTLIVPAFGTNKLGANGTLSSSLAIQWSPLPSTITFGFTGVDASGTKWSQSVSMSTGK